MKRYLSLIMVVSSGLSAAADEQASHSAGAMHFDKTVAPLLAARCLECHSGPKPKGELDLSQRDTAMNGGESGVVIVPAKPEESLLWERIGSDEMPPKHPLSNEEKAIFKKWLADGAAWGNATINRFRFSTDRRAGYDWWSLQRMSLSFS